MTTFFFGVWVSAEVIYLCTESMGNYFLLDWGWLSQLENHLTEFLVNLPMFAVFQKPVLLILSQRGNTVFSSYWVNTEIFCILFNKWALLYVAPRKLLWRPSYGRKFDIIEYSDFQSRETSTFTQIMYVARTVRVFITFYNKPNVRCKSPTNRI